MVRLSGLLLLGLLLFSSSVLALQTFYLPDVIVTASRIPQKISDQPWNSCAITAKMLEDSGSETIAEALNKIAGIDISSNGYTGGAAAARIRGASSQQTLVLLNGCRINSPTLGLADIGTLGLADVEKIEVVKAPLSALYGSSAVGGVVNIITKSSSRRGNLGITAEESDCRTKKYGVSLSGKNYFLSAQSVRSDGYRTNSDFESTNYFAGGSFNGFELNLKNYEDKKGSPGSTFFPSATAREKNSNYYFDLSRNNLYGFNFTTHFNLLESSYIDSLYFIDSLTQTKTYGLSFNRADEFNQLEILYGSDIDRDVSISSDSGRHNLNGGGVYAQGKKTLPAGFLYAGGRVDFSSIARPFFSPRLGAAVKTIGGADLKISWAGSFKAPTINDLYWNSQSFTYGGTTYTTAGNSGLKPEHGYGVDLTLGKQWGETDARISFFENKIYDMIRWETTLAPSSVTYQPMNIDNVEVNGFEIEVNRQLAQYLSLSVGYTWQDARNESWEKYVTYSPKNKYTAGLNFDHPALAISLSQRFVGERYADFANTQMLPGYAVADLAVVRKMSDLRVKGKIENIFDVQYEEVSGYPQPGRRFLIGISGELFYF